MRPQAEQRTECFLCQVYVSCQHLHACTRTGMSHTISSSYARICKFRQGPRESLSSSSSKCCRRQHNALKVFSASAMSPAKSCVLAPMRIRDISITPSHAYAQPTSSGSTLLVTPQPCWITLMAADLDIRHLYRSLNPSHKQQPFGRSCLSTVDLAFVILRGPVPGMRCALRFTWPEGLQRSELPLCG